MIYEKERIIEQDYSEFVVTEKTRQNTREHPEMYTGCSARVRMGKFYTTEEYEKYVQESLSRPLPSDVYSKKSLKKVLGSSRLKK